MDQKGGIRMRDRMRESFNAYKRMYGEWEAKGYRMFDRMNFKEYKQKFALAKDAGTKNIARTFAHDSIVTTKTEARQFIKEIGVAKRVRERVYNEKGKYVVKKTGKRYDIREYTRPGIAPEEAEKFTIKYLTETGAKAVYDELREKYGFSAREAGSYVDDLYIEAKR